MENSQSYRATFARCMDTELCDGLDNDCNAITDDAAPPAGTPVLAVDETKLSWGALPDPDSYDVVQGDLEMLSSTAGDFAQSTQACLARVAAVTSIAYSKAPEPGRGFWFLVRGVNCGGNGTFDSLESSQIGSRDPGIDASAGACG